MAKYLTKQQVVAQFKLNYMPELRKMGLSDDKIKQAWDLYMDSLLADKKITEKQKRIWSFPKELLD